MTDYHTELTKLASFDGLRHFLDARAGTPPADFESFEIELGRLMRQVEADLLGAELSRYDVEAERIVVEGVELRRVLTAEPKMYLTSAGPVTVSRSLFRASGGAKSICPLELRVGIIGSVATPRLGRQVCFLMGHMTSTDTAEVFLELGIPGPSTSTCDRLPKVVSGAWEKQRDLFDAALRAEETVPAEATVVAVSLDGVMVPDKAAQREAKLERERAAKEGRAKKDCGPAGYREVGCGTVTLYAPGDEGDAEEAGKPQRLETMRYGREPEHKKATLTRQLDAEVDSILAVRPDLQLVALADGAEENWRYFDAPKWEKATKIVDIGHGTEHLKAGLAAYYGQEAIESRAEYEKLKVIVKDKPGGVDEVLAELKRLQQKMRKGMPKTRRKALAAEVTYFTNQRDRMDYAGYQARGLPIGSGIVEAACKTLATQRLKRSGMSWGDGKQPVLTIRSLQQSERWSRGWSLVSATFKRPVALLKRRGHLSEIVPLDVAA